MTQQRGLGPPCHARLSLSPSLSTPLSTSLYSLDAAAWVRPATDTPRDRLRPRTWDSDFSSLLFWSSTQKANKTEIRTSNVKFSKVSRLLCARPPRLKRVCGEQAATPAQRPARGGVAVELVLVARQQGRDVAPAAATESFVRSSARRCSHSHFCAGGRPGCPGVNGHVSDRGHGTAATA